MKTSSKSRARDPEAKFSVTHQMNSQSLLVIKNLWLNDTGTYICTMTTKVPSPTRTFRGYGTRLEVYASPKVWLSSSAVAALHTALVTCTVSKFYPPTLHITLNTTCGGYKVLDDNASVIMTDDGTFNMTYKAWVNAADCHNGTEVTCSVKQLKEMHRTLWIPGKRNEAASKQDLVLDQPPVVRALRGESVTLACSCDVCNYPDFHSEWRFTSGNRGPGTILAVKTALSSKHLDPPYKFSVTHQRNSRSLLLIKNLQINDQGTYMCTMIKNVPPPTVILKGPGTQLEVYALPKVWLFASPSEAALPMALVTCAVKDFYPQSLYATLNATCGLYEALADNASAVMTGDGTFNMTLQAWVNVTNCQNGTEVTCLVRQLTAETRRILWIPRAKNKALLPVPIILIRFLFGGAVVLWLTFLLGCFMKKHFSFDKPSERTDWKQDFARFCIAIKLHEETGDI